MIRRALLSVSDKTGLITFAQELASMGVELISTGGTAKTLRDAGLNVTPVERITGFPEMMDGRVKTLHPFIHGAILGRRDLASHSEAMQAHGITPIDLVCVNLYPFEQTIAQPNVADEEAIEQIDIGGPSMVRSAAKNHASVTVVTAPEQYERVIAEMRANNGETTLQLRRELAAAAFARTADYDAAIAAWISGASTGGFPSTLRLSYAHQADLRYGENPHQKAAVYRAARPQISDLKSHVSNLTAARMLHGKPLSYNNLLDSAAALELVGDLNAVSGGAACAAIIKHANPCGAAVAGDLPAAFHRAYAGDPLAAYGGILAVNTPIDSPAAAEICEGKKFLEVIIAPHIDEAAVSALAERWKNVRLLALGEMKPQMNADEHRCLEYRSIPGGLLVQERDSLLPDPATMKHVAGPEPDQRMRNDAAFICTVVKHLKSNAIAIGRGGQLLGGGMGQVDRVTACRLAVERAGERLRKPDVEGPPIAASDAFFPFPDGPAILIDAGVKCIVHPGGSVRDQETIDLCNERNVTLLITGTRHFRH